MMAGKTKKEYTSKAVTTTIRVASRCSVKIKDAYFTVEYGEERTVPIDADIEKERKLLWDDANRECDNQIADIYNNCK